MIYIANHSKWFDNWIVWEVLNREGMIGTLRIMMSDSLARTPLGLFYLLCGAFPARAGDNSLELPTRYLSEGHSVLIYPEGKGTMETRPGARELSIRTGVSIIPLLITGPVLNVKRLFFERHQIKVRIGEAFTPEEGEDVMVRVREL